MTAKVWGEPNSVRDDNQATTGPLGVRRRPTLLPARTRAINVSGCRCSTVRTSCGGGGAKGGVTTWS